MEVEKDVKGDELVKRNGGDELVKRNGEGINGRYASQGFHPSLSFEYPLYPWLMDENETGHHLLTLSLSETPRPSDPLSRRSIAARLKPSACRSWISRSRATCSAL